MNSAGNYRLTGAQQPEMSWDRLDRLDWHLWLLAVMLIVVLGVSLLSFMFPSAFWFGEESSIQRPQRAFFGFCVLLSLVLVYLLQRQAIIRKLKRQLVQSQADAIATRSEAAAQSFQTLPGMGQFRDTLAMEFRRASTSDANLAVVLLTVANSGQEGLQLVSKIPQHDFHASQSHHPQEIFDVVLVARDQSAKHLQPSEETLDRPAPPIPA